ncbi:MAG: alpha-galactosidase [Spirochaetes bacterium]|nr:alpha-galactosidase [Spirochaetota bacterium]
MNKYINFEEKHGIFHLKTENTSYALKIHDSGHLQHLYYGALIKVINDSIIPFNQEFNQSVKHHDTKLNFSLEELTLEYPGYGFSDFRESAYELELKNGISQMEFTYSRHEIYSGKKSLEGLPAVYYESGDNTESLEITCTSNNGVELILKYTAFYDFDIITRSVLVRNNSVNPVNLTKLASCSIDFYNSDYSFLSLTGKWGREKHVKRQDLTAGKYSIESRRGISGHHHNPFLAVFEKNCSEDSGNVFGFNLVYSGNFLSSLEVSQTEMLRVQLGINPFKFRWKLNPGETFQSPEAVLTFSTLGFNGISQNFHKVFRKRLCRGKFRDAERPVIYNNWEATYFDFDDAKLENLAEKAAELGVEIFVLDDGWFGKRNDDRSSLGDWFVNTGKLQKGLSGFAEKLSIRNMKLGLWFEPEMISEKSDLFSAHPDWIFQVPGTKPCEGRYQFVLDFSRKEVTDYVYERVSDILRNNPISYIKWDMNRALTDVFSRELGSENQGELFHRYVLGLYSVLEKLNCDFPDILFESCSSGGGRLDPGMLYYMPQTWTSDNTDAGERMLIQYGTSYAYPQSSFTSHVSESPNHQINRITKISDRINTAFLSNFGLELNLMKLSEAESMDLKKTIIKYKKSRKTVQYGDFYRILNPFESNYSSWLIINNVKDEFIVFTAQLKTESDYRKIRLKLKGLDSGRKYMELNSGKIYHADMLQNAGLPVDFDKGDFSSKLFFFEAVD